MQYAMIENKLRNVPEEYLDEVGTFIDYLLFREQINQPSSQSTGSRSYFGKIPSLGDGMELQRQMRNEWN